MAFHFEGLHRYSHMRCFHFHLCESSTTSKKKLLDPTHNFIKMSTCSNELYSILACIPKFSGGIQAH